MKRGHDGGETKGGTSMNKFQQVLCGLYAVLSDIILSNEELHLFVPSESEAELAIHHGEFSPLMEWASIVHKTCNRLLEAFYEVEETDVSDKHDESWGNVDFETVVDSLSEGELAHARMLLKTLPPKEIEAFHVASVALILSRLLTSPDQAS